MHRHYKDTQCTDPSTHQSQAAVAATAAAAVVVKVETVITVAVVMTICDVFTFCTFQHYTEGRVRKTDEKAVEQMNGGIIDSK